MIEAQSYWTEKTDPLGDAFVMVSQAIEKVRQGVRLQPASAAVWLIRAFRSEACALIEPQNFGKLARTCGYWYRDPAEERYNISRLALVHPTLPSAELSLWFLEQCYQADEPSVFIHDLLNPLTNDVGYDFFWYIIRTAQILNRNGRVPEVRQVLEYGRFWAPNMFEGRAGHFEERRDGLDQRSKVRRQLSASELAGGATMDADGARMFDKEFDDVFRAQQKLESWRK